jgi:hypothetical protein
MKKKMKNGLSLKKLVIIAVVVVYNKFNKWKAISFGVSVSNVIFV